jgi:hypothetical protein
MNYRSYKNYLVSNLQNSLGRKLNEKLIIFESDDWGAIRMPNLKTRDKLLAIGAIKESNPYARFDAIANDEDWDQLLSCLAMFKDKNSNPPIFTANFILANPDFQRISATKFEEYFYEAFSKTINRYSQTSNYQNYLQHAINSRLFKPQLHGREHLNPHRWLKALKSGDECYLKAFEQNCFFVEPKAHHFYGKDIFAALDFDHQDELAQHELILSESINLFKKHFSYSPKSFIAPNYIWSKAHEYILQSQGITSIQGTKFRNNPVLMRPGYKRKIRLMARNYFNTPLKIVRNCFFEPSSGAGANSVEACLRHINLAFNWNQPAVISTHRLNYIGRLSTENRKTNISLLKRLLIEILRLWPDVSFISSDELAARYNKKEK